MTNSDSAKKSNMNSVLSAPEFLAYQKEKKLSPEQALFSLVKIAKKMSVAPVTNFNVGAAALGQSGKVYLGTNLEFANLPLGITVHAEQFAIARAYCQGEEAITTLATSALPCGHCRQFLTELNSSSTLRIVSAENSSFTLEALLPHSFGPKDLGIKAGLFSTQEHKQNLKNKKTAIPEELFHRALTGFNRSYVPYSKQPVGVALATAKAKYFWGCGIESAAINPSLMALTVALINLLAEGAKLTDITEAAILFLPSAKTSKAEHFFSKQVLQTLSPKAVWYEFSQ